MLRLVALILTSLVLCGCPPPQQTEPPAVHRELPTDVATESLTVAGLVQVYGTSVFVYASGDPESGGRIFDDTAAAKDDTALADARLLVLVEGSGDSLAGFRHTARLITSSRWAWPGDNAGAPLLIVPLHWCKSADPISEHLDYKAQCQGAAAIQDICRAHALRHSRARGAELSILGFSAGCRVIQMAFGCTVKEGQANAVDSGQRADQLRHVANIVFVGASIARDDPTPYDCIHGRFINFVNPRDTHFGDRAPYAAPAGSAVTIDRLVNTRFLERQPGFGASANGFDRLPTFTAPEQFAAADSSPAARLAFRMINVRVPPALLAYGLTGLPVNNDNFDDFWNLAPNHYIMVGRGPGGKLDGPMFGQYRNTAAEFVQNFLAPALLRASVPATDLVAKPVRINPLAVPGQLVQPLLAPLESKSQPKAGENK